jgi:hypothetical protein
MHHPHHEPGDGLPSELGVPADEDDLAVGDRVDRVVSDEVDAEVPGGGVTVGAGSARAVWARHGGRGCEAVRPEDRHSGSFQGYGEPAVTDGRNGSVAIRASKDQAAYIGAMTVPRLTFRGWVNRYVLRLECAHTYLGQPSRTGPTGNVYARCEVCGAEVQTTARG